MELVYENGIRAIAVVDTAVSQVDLDGAVFWKAAKDLTPRSFLLPTGQHNVTFRPAEPPAVQRASL